MNSFSYKSDPWWEDAMQEAKLKYFVDEVDIPDEIEREKWLNTTAINIIHNMRRKNSHTVCFTDICSTEDDIDADVPEKLGHFHTPRIVEQLSFLTIYQNIEPRYCAISVLRYSGFNNKEIAEIYKISPECLKKRIIRGRSKAIKLFAEIF